MPLKLSTAVRAGEELIPGTCRKQYFLLAADRGVMFACLTGMAYLGSYPVEEAKTETLRLKSLMRFGNGKGHTAAHGITKRLHGAFPDLGRAVAQFPRLLRVTPVRLTKEQSKHMTLFGFLTHLFDDKEHSVEDCCTLLEKAGL